jgi:hypothetical protein
LVQSVSTIARSLQTFSIVSRLSFWSPLLLRKDPTTLRFSTGKKGEEEKYITNERKVCQQLDPQKKISRTASYTNSISPALAKNFIIPLFTDNFHLPLGAESPMHGTFGDSNRASNASML